jgi:hypothetical protein
MDLAIPRTRNTHREGDKEAKKMAKEHEESKAHAIKLLKKAHRIRGGDLVWLNIKDFKMHETSFQSI